MNTVEYVDIFRTIATSHVDIAHSDDNRRFYRMDIEEIFNGLRSEVDWGKAVLMLESYEGRLKDNNSDNILDERTCAFSVLKRVTIDDFDQIHEALDSCEAIGKDIISYLRNMKHDEDDRRLRGLNIASFTYQKVGPVLDGAYGYRFTFTFFRAINLALDSEKWQ